MITPLLAVIDDTLPNSGNQYTSMYGGLWEDTWGQLAYGRIPTGGKIKNLKVKMNMNAGTSPDAYKFTLYVDNAPTALTCTLTAPATEGEDITHEVDVVAHDDVNLVAVGLNTPSNQPTQITIYCEFEGTDGTEAILMGGGVPVPSGATTRYKIFQEGMSDWVYTTGRGGYNLFPCAGTLKTLRVKSMQPGSGDTRTFTVCHGESNTETDIEVTCVNLESCYMSDTVNTYEVSAGELITFKYVGTGTPYSPAYTDYGIVFVPDVAGQFPIMSCSIDSPSTTLEEYIALSFSRQSRYFSTTESDRQSLVPHYKLSAMYVDLDDAPGTDTSYIFTIRVDGVDSDLIVEISDTNKTGNNTSDSVEVDDKDLVSIECNPEGSTPVATEVAVGVVMTLDFGWASGDPNGVDVATIAEINGVEIGNIAEIDGVA